MLEPRGSDAERARAGPVRCAQRGQPPDRAGHRFALELLRKSRLPTDGLRSKSWDEFTAPRAPRLDFVYTVCDNAAGEVCPLWPGQPVTARWGVEDPAAVEGSDDDKHKAFLRAHTTLLRQIELFVSLPHGKLDRLARQERDR